MEASESINTKAISVTRSVEVLTDILYEMQHFLESNSNGVERYKALRIEKENIEKIIDEITGV